MKVKSILLTWALILGGFILFSQYCNEPVSEDSADQPSSDTLVIEKNEASVDFHQKEVISTRLSFEKRHIPETLNWEKIDKGLEYVEADAPLLASVGDSKISILKIDPEVYKFELLSAKIKGRENKTVEEWADDFGLIAVINAGMFQTDYKTNVGFMKNYDFINNSHMQKDYNLMAAFNRKSDNVAPFQLIDLECQPWEEWKNKYNSYTQSIRMIDCNQENKWSKQERFWSMITIGTDQAGNVLFVFTRTPYRVHDFTNMILQLPLNIDRLMYLEGGPEASLFVKYKGKEVKKMGSYESGFNQADDNYHFWSLPNVIGVKKIN
ncbi:MAG: phosphodiester glycosidase family protein [Bacteroidota bacterium]